MDQNVLNNTISPNQSIILNALNGSLATDANKNYDNDWSDEALQQTRFIIQRIIVPCVVIIGIAGNLLTVVVLTRYSTDSNYLLINYYDYLIKVNLTPFI